MSTNNTKYTCTLSKESLAKAQKELHEDPDTRIHEIRHLRERLLRQPGLTPRVDDAYLLKFLRARKFDQEKTFKLIMNHYLSKQQYDTMYIEMNPRDCHAAVDAGIMCLLPNRTKNGEAVVIARFGLWDPVRIPIDDLNKLFLMGLQTLVESEEIQVNGVVWVGDMTGFTWEHAKHMTPAVSKKIFGIVQEAFPMRLKGIHYLNEPTLFDAVFAIFKPFLKEKIKKRVHFHGSDVKGLHEFIDPEFLPEEYGGKLPPLCPKETNERLRKRQAEFEEDLKFGLVDMAMHNGQKSKDAIQTMSGTFKKLNVD